MIYKRLQRHRHANESGVGERLNGDLVDFPRSSPLYRRHRFLREVISYAVGLYFLFPMSLRKVEEMLPERGICVTYETVRQCGLWRAVDQNAFVLDVLVPRRRDSRAAQQRFCCNDEL